MSADAERILETRLAEALARVSRLEQELAQQRLRPPEIAAAEAARRLEEILASVADGFVSITFDWRFSFVNRAGADILRRSPEELIGLPVFDAWPKMQGTRFEAEMRQAMQRRSRLHFEVEVASLGAWLECRVYPASEGLSVFFSNITAAKQAEQVLADSEARFRALTEDMLTRLHAAVDDAERSRAQLEAVFDAVNDGIAVADMSGRFVLMNEAEATISGYANTREMLRDLDYFARVFELRTLEDRVLPTSEWPISRVLRGESLHDVVLYARRNDTGRSWYFSFSAEPVRDETGKQVLAVVVTRDVTERRHAMIELRAANARLQQADARKDEFLAVLSHELRNPLTAIKNSAYLLDRAAPGSEVGRRARAVIDRQVGHLARLVDDLLDATRITSNKVRLQRRSLDLRDLIRDAVEDQRPGFDASGVRLSAELPTAPVLVEADPERLAQVVGNLLQNAAKFASPGGHARVSLTVDADRRQAVIAVDDDGIGMDSGTLERIFDPFMQADTSLDRSKGGLGLGLALVKNLVELHGGEVSAHSDGLGAGSRLQVRLPLSDLGPITVGAAPRKAAGLPRRVLIIEDNVDAAELLRDLLQLGDHTVALAFSGPEGIARAREFRPDVVLCDIGLPAMDGHAVAAAMRSDPALADICLIALSGYAQPEDVRRATAAGFDHHVAKPPDLDRLEIILRSPDCGRT